MSNKSNNPKSKKQTVEPVPVPVPSLKLDMGAIRAATAGIKHAREAVEWSQQQERLANNEYERREKKGKTLPVHSPDTVWLRSPVQLTSEEIAKSHSAENNANFERAITFGGKRKTNKRKSLKKTKKTKKNKKSKKSKKTRKSRR
jgi:hypothetical protein